MNQQNNAQGLELSSHTIQSPSTPSRSRPSSAGGGSGHSRVFTNSDIKKTKKQVKFNAPGTTPDGKGTSHSVFHDAVVHQDDSGAVSSPNPFPAYPTPPTQNQPPVTPPTPQPQRSVTPPVIEVSPAQEDDENDETGDDVPPTENDAPDDDDDEEDEDDLPAPRTFKFATPSEILNFEQTIINGPLEYIDGDWDIDELDDESRDMTLFMRSRYTDRAEVIRYVMCLDWYHIMTLPIDDLASISARMYKALDYLPLYHRTLLELLYNIYEYEVFLAVSCIVLNDEIYQTACDNTLRIFASRIIALDEPLFQRYNRLCVNWVPTALLGRIVMSGFGFDSKQRLRNFLRKPDFTADVKDQAEVKLILIILRIAGEYSCCARGTIATQKVRSRQISDVLTYYSPLEKALKYTKCPINAKLFLRNIRRFIDARKFKVLPLWMHPGTVRKPQAPPAPTPPPVPDVPLHLAVNSLHLPSSSPPSRSSSPTPLDVSTSTTAEGNILISSNPNCQDEEYCRVYPVEAKRDKVRPSAEASVAKLESVNRKKLELQHLSQCIEIVNARPSPRRNIVTRNTVADPIVKDTDINAQQWQDKYGDFCVANTGMKLTALNVNMPGTTSTILQQIVPIVRAARHNYDIVEDQNGFYRQVGSDVFLPHEREDAVQRHVNQYFPMVLRRARNLTPFLVTATAAVVQKMGTTLPTYTELTQGIIDSKRLTSTLQNIIAHASRQFAEGMTRHATANLNLYSYQTLFTITWLISFIIHDLEALQIPIEFTRLVPNDITFVDVSGNDPVENTNRMNAALSQGRITFITHEVNETDLACMRIISACTQGTGTPADHEFAHVISSFHFEHNIRWTIITNTNAHPVPPANPRVTTHQLLTFARMVATTFNRYEDLVSGFIRAATMATQRVRPVQGQRGREAFAILSTLEIQNTSMPAVFGDNFLWRHLCAGEVIEEQESYRIEARILQDIEMESIRDTATAVACFVSLGFSHVFHEANITGTNLAHAQRDTPHNRAFGLIRDMCETSGGQLIPTLCVAACNYVGAISTMAICAHAFRMSQWSGNAISMAFLNPELTWRTVWPRAIPYFIHPLVTHHLGYLMDAKWGIIAPGVHGEFFNELREFMDYQQRAWYASSGDHLYADRAASRMPHQYITYGCTAMNVMMQQSRQVVVRVRYQAIRNAPAGRAQLPVPRFHANVELQIDPVLHTIIPGTVLTYCWDTNCVYAPVLVLQELNPAMVQVLETPVMSPFTRAGIAGPRQDTFTPVATAFADLVAASQIVHEAGVKGLSLTDAASSLAGSTKPDGKGDKGQKPPKKDDKRPDTKSAPKTDDKNPISELKPEAAKPTVKVPEPTKAEVNTEVKKAAAAVGDVATPKKA